MTESPTVIYAREQELTPAEFRQILIESGFGPYRPIDDEPRLTAMLTGANLIVTARLDTPERPLVGVARAMTDFAWSCYLSELAVAPAVQRLGIGRGLIEEARRQLGPAVSVILLSTPDAVPFYERIAMRRIEHAFWFRRER